MMQRLCRPGARRDLYRLLILLLIILLHDSTQESMVIDTGSHVPGTTTHHTFRIPFTVAGTLSGSWDHESIAVDTGSWHSGSWDHE